MSICDLSMIETPTELDKEKEKSKLSLLKYFNLNFIESRIN